MRGDRGIWGLSILPIQLLTLLNFILKSAGRQTPDMRKWASLVVTVKSWSKKISDSPLILFAPNRGITLDYREGSCDTAARIRWRWAHCRNVMGQRLWNYNTPKNKLLCPSVSYLWATLHQWCFHATTRIQVWLLVPVWQASPNTESQFCTF